MKELNSICDKVKNCFINKKKFVDEEYITILSWLLYIAQIRSSNGFLNQQSKMTLTDKKALKTIDDLVQAGVKLNQNDKESIYKFLWTKKLTSENKINTITKIILSDFINAIKERYDVELKDSDN
ncbi:hypothetical protein H9X77_13950, partial [Clostridium saudiense]|nr:hypothetical protein [Clostridium saudiense]